MVMFNEFGSSPSFGGSPTSVSGKRTGLILWTDIVPFFAEVFPPPVSNSGFSNSEFGISMPGYPGLRAKSATIKPHNKKIINGGVADFGSLCDYEYAVAEITYGYESANASQTNESKNNDPIPLLTHQWSSGGEFLSLPGTGLKYESDDSALEDDDQDATIMIPTIEHTISWPMVLYPPFPAIRDNIGKANKKELTFVTGTADPETILFVGASMSRDVTTAGLMPWQVTYNFSEKRIQLDEDGTKFGGWSHVWRPSVGKFEKVMRKDGTDLPLYLEGELSDLFEQEFV